MNILIIFALILSVYSRYLSIDYVKYLETYGYLNVTANSNHTRTVNDITSALLAFQQKYNLERSGVLDNQTLELMLTPRCGVKDFNNGVPFRFQTVSSWNIKYFLYHIKNQLPYMNSELLVNAINQSFTRWSQHTELEFHRTGIASKTAYTIDIRFAPSFAFNGPNDVAAAFFPQYGGDIALKQLPHWKLPDKNGKLPTTRISLVQALTHEIGHSLGLGHSNHRKSIMYPYMGHTQHDLDVDDIRGIQSSYVPGRCKNSEIDTIFSTNSSTIFIFKNANYWVLKMNPFGKHLIFDHKPKTISNKWRELPANIGASLYYGGFTYFLKDKLTWKYFGTMLETGYPKKISTEFVGVPNQIDAAMVGNDNNMYFFKGTHFWKIEPNGEFKITHDSPQSIAKFGLSYSIDASISLQHGTYFFKKNVYLQMGATNYPKSTGHYWFKCLLLSGNIVNVQ